MLSVRATPISTSSPSSSIPFDSSRLEFDPLDSSSTHSTRVARHVEARVRRIEARGVPAPRGWTHSRRCPPGGRPQRLPRALVRSSVILGVLESREWSDYSVFHFRDSLLALEPLPLSDSVCLYRAARIDEPLSLIVARPAMGDPQFVLFGSPIARYVVSSRLE